MGPDWQHRFERIELRLTEDEEKIIARDRSLSGIRNLLQTGIRMLVEMESRMNALIDSQTMLQGAVQQLAEAQRRTEDSLKRFLDRSGNGHSSRSPE